MPALSGPTLVTSDNHRLRDIPDKAAVGRRLLLQLEIDIDVPGGINDELRRIVEENCRALKFRSAGFEAE